MMQQRLTNKAIRIAIVALLIASTFCRASWATQLVQHESAPVVDPIELAEAHGHYHPPHLDHVHDESSGLSDDDHPFVHVVLAFDHQVFLVALPERSYLYAENTYPPVKLRPLAPYKADLYRPPR